MVVGAALLAAAPVYKNLSLSKERNVPKIEFSIYGASFGGTEPSFDKSFDGVKIVNTGHTEIVLDAITMDVALPEESKTLRELWGVEPAYEYNGSPLNVNRESLPHRLMPGDSFVRLYDRDRIMQATQGRRIRPMCQDTLGNVYRPRFWLSYEGNHGTTANSDPGPGMREPTM